MPKPLPRLPGSSDRIVIVGRTGSGKTRCAVWHLSKQDFDVRPWVIIDYKGDELINEIEGAQLIDFSVIPDKPGIYILRVLPGEQEQLSNWFLGVWQHEGIGIYIDEGYMVGQRDQWFNACLTQGRSKRIPMIILSQRPLWMSRFAFSEASFIQLFALTDMDDIKVVRRFIKSDDAKNDLREKLPKFHSWYYDVGEDTISKFGPVPKDEKILSNIAARMPKRSRRAI